MRKLCLSLSILFTGFELAGCSDSSGPEQLGPLTDASIVFTGFSLNTAPLNKLYAVLPDGTGFRMLTTGLAEAIHPHWSRDGEKIAYVVNMNGPQEIWVMLRDQTDAHKVATAACPSTLELLSWSPTGNRVVVDCRGVNQWVIDVSTGAQYSLRDAWGRQAEAPDWSPLGDKLLYAQRPDVYVANLDGSGETLVLSSASQAVWSPDGAHIAFAGSITSSRNAIFVANADGTGIRQLSFPPGDFASDISPSWSHNGTRIVFDRISTTPGGLHVIGADGSGDTAIPSITVDVSYPSW